MPVFASDLGIPYGRSHHRLGNLIKGTGPTMHWNFKRVLACFAIFLLTFGAVHAQAQAPLVVPSRDGTPISYEVHGSGEPTLIFVHGWSCNARYWDGQVPHFAKQHRVVVLDLAGHGRSGSSRERYTMAAFGEDVRAVTDAIGGGRVILVGHSMGGTVIAEAARIMPERVIGLIGVDTLENVEYPLTRETMHEMLAPFEKDFPAAARQFVSEMISPQTDATLRDWILSDISAAPPAVAVSAMREMLELYVTGEAAKMFDEIKIPVVCVNGDLWPIDYKANRRHMASFEAIVLEGADHFLMMNRSEAFNEALEKAIRMVNQDQN
jgi:pimeloyl-ACP methyl ester carboxylesterase